MFRIIADYLGNTLITDIPRDLYALKEDFASIGYAEPLGKTPIVPDEESDLELNIYPDGDLEQAAFRKCKPEDTLLMLNKMAGYLEDHAYSFTAERIQAMDADGLSELYCRLSEPRQPETDKLVLHMRLVRRAEDFTPETCIVEKVIPLPPEEFFRLRNDPLEEHPLMMKYFDDMLSDDEGFRHGILVYDEVQGDGLFIAAEGQDYARYAQYVPCAKDIAAAFAQTQTQEETAEITEDSGGLIMA